MENLVKLTGCWKPPIAILVAIYAHTAADDWAGAACDRQVAALRAARGPSTEPLVYTDAACSGLGAHRPGLRRLLAAAQRREFDRLVVRDVARLARDASLLADVLRALREAGVTVVTSAEVIDG